MAATNVLLIDDEPDLLEIGKHFLELEEGISVETAFSADNALEKIKLRDYDALVSDYQMPRKDGIQLLKEIRGMKNSIPFILFTGKGREEVAIEAFEIGADFYLQKGGSPKAQFAELGHKIRWAVDLRRADMEVVALRQLYSVLSETNRAIVRFQDKRELLDHICRINVEIGGFSMVWAGLSNPKSQTIEPVASHGRNIQYPDGIAISTGDIPWGQGPTGIAFREGKFRVCNDVANDLKVGPWHDEALRQGYASLAVFPFAIGTENAGVLALYSSEPGYFTSKIIKLLDEQSGDISWALVTFEQKGKRLLAEKELEKSELQYRRLFETAQDAILILDGESGKIIEANTFFLDLLGFPLEHCIGKQLWELGFIKDKKLAQQEFTDLKTKGYIRYEDLPLETKDGRCIDVDFISHAFLAGDRKIFQCSIRDITNRKEFEDDLKASELQYRRLFETAKDGIMILDFESQKIIDANVFILDLMGYQLHEVIGKGLWELGFQDDRAFADGAFARLRTSGYVRYEDIPLRKKNGETVPVEFVSNVYTVKETKIVQCNIRDVSDRQQKEEKIRELARIVDSTGDGVIGKDLDGIITSWNRGAEQIYGYKQEEMIGRSISLLTAPDSKEDMENTLKRVGNEELLSHYESTHTRKDGERIDVSLTVSPVLGIRGQITGSSTISSDITARKRMEDALKLANKKLGLLSNVTRHDINNQMTALIGNIELLERGIKDPSSERHFLRAKEAMERISTILKFTKTYADIGVHAPEWNNVRRLVGRSVREAQIGNIKVVNDIPPEIEVLADPLILNVFSNLMDNSIRHGGTVDMVRFHIDEHRGVSSIVYEDNGFGLPTETRKKIFGLAPDRMHGMFLTKEILSITGITIVEVGESGQGARFVMTIPPNGIRIIPHGVGQ